MNNIKYRPDVDGLRAVAVILVILFHMNSGWIPGGFIGVDIFFVISGFIITSTIYPQIVAKEFSFNLFYIKRIKRILPLFYLVVVVSLLFASWLYTPSDFIGFADSWRYSSAFIANIYFEKHSGYFAPTSETLPLLHTWSLSIEEQFYFVWPMVLLLAAKYLPKRFLIAFVALSFTVFVGYSQILTSTDPEKGYYFIQSRAFELLGGALLAIVLFNKTLRRTLSPNLLQVSGITGLVGAVFLAFQLNESGSFPGINAFWVVLTSCLIILSGENQRSLISRLLSARPTVFVGRLSYSLYLWHWPVLAFYRYYNIGFTPLDAAVCGLITLLLSLVSWRFFETKLRHLPMKKRWVYLFYLVLPITLSVITAKIIVRNEGYPERFPESVADLYNSSESSFEVEKLTLPQAEGYSSFEPYIIGDNTKTVSTLIWGDSHAGHFRSFIDFWGKNEGFSSLYGGMGACPPLLNVERLKYGKPDEQCTNRNNELVDDIARIKPDKVFIAARWAMYAETTLNLGEKGSRIYLGDEYDHSESVANSRHALENGLINTIEFLLKNQISPVIFEQVPDYPFKPSNCWIKKEMYRGMDSVSCNLDRKQVDERFLYVDEMFSRIKGDYPSVKFISIEDIVCDKQICFSKLNGVPLYGDNNHLNLDGAKEIGRVWYQSVNNN